MEEWVPVGVIGGVPLPPSSPVDSLGFLSTMP